MPSVRGQRISNAIDSLITHLVPEDLEATEEAAREHHDTCFELVRSILEKCGRPFAWPHHQADHFHLLILLMLMLTTALGPPLPRPM